ncbi:unnamed protein product [Heligmosomoides polygyrus]|uniref:HEPN domain-containing protein n=1 Tax=Heligmosomoides polygyrus TaxID=6339 RepID=A0A183FRD9_HELPZ|nr:unnamed protein product [Heligmosomoides polygyrus]
MKHLLPEFVLVLPHVLEAYDIPESKVAEDVVNALATTDWGSATVKWLERKMVFVVFASLHRLDFYLSAACESLNVLLLCRARPKTHAGVARRMVESTLGLRSALSKEQRDAERKQLSDAKGLNMISSWLQWPFPGCYQRK